MDFGRWERPRKSSARNAPTEGSKSCRAGCASLRTFILNKFDVTKRTGLGRPFGQADSHELPACVWWEKIAVSFADVRLRGGARAAAQDVLIAHEFAVVF